MGSMLMLFAGNVAKIKGAARTKTVTLTVRVNEPYYATQNFYEKIYGSVIGLRN